MAIRNRIAAFATTMVWPGHTVQWTTGWTRYCPANTPHVEGVRLLVVNGQGRVVDVVDGETLAAVAVKLMERYRVNLVWAEQLKRRARLPRATF
jgi:hypothetical protein